MHPQVIRSLGLIWVSHRSGRHFLRRVGADEVTQRHVRAAVDIEATLRSINLILSVDQRVSSVLLARPLALGNRLGFQGYVDSKSRRSASRFGRGLVEVYMESDWRLKRILGLEKGRSKQVHKYTGKYVACLRVYLSTCTDL